MTLRCHNEGVTEDDLIRTLDRTLEDNSRVIALNQQAFRQMVAALNRLERTVTGLRGDTADMRDQIAANAHAVLRLLDRLDPSARSA